MATVFLKFSQNVMMPHGGEAAPGETCGFDSVADAVFISSAVASGAAAVGSAPVSGSMDMPTPLPTTRVQFTGKRGSIMVNNNPPLYAPGEIATFLAPVSAALIASGDAVAN